MALALSVGFAAGALLMGGDQEISQTVLVNNTTVTNILQEKIKNEGIYQDTVLPALNKSVQDLENVEIKGDFKANQTINLTLVQTQQIKDVDIDDFSASIATDIINEAKLTAQQTTAGIDFSSKEITSTIENNTQIITNETQRLVNNVITSLNTTIEASNDNFTKLKSVTIGGDYDLNQTIDINAVISQQVDQFSSAGFEASAATMIMNESEQSASQTSLSIGAIIGIVIVGCAVVGAISGAIALFAKKKKKSSGKSSIDNGFGILNFGRRKR